MHELSICQSLVSQVNAIAQQQHAVYVDKIHLRVGPLSGVETELLENAFPFAAAHTLAERAQLLVVSMPILVLCNACQSQTEASTNRLVCAQCGDWHTTLVSGDELILERVELEIEN